MKVVWKISYNIQEIKIGECDSEDIGKDVSDYYDDEYEEIFRNNELSTAPGKQDILNTHRTVWKK